jgi:hypothetical protein
MHCRFIKNQSEAASILCKPIVAKLWPISEHRKNCNTLSDCCLHINKYHLAHRRPNTKFYRACRTYANFFYLLPILRQFRIIRCNRQAALRSALLNYTPLVIGGTDKKQLTVIKPTYTGINCNKLFGAPKIYKNQPLPLVRPCSVNFWQKFLKSISWDSPLIWYDGTLKLFTLV